jgi:hypothetical protein
MRAQEVALAMIFEKCAVAPLDAANPRSSARHFRNRLLSRHAPRRQGFDKAPDTSPERHLRACCCAALSSIKVHPAKV